MPDQTAAMLKLLTEQLTPDKQEAVLRIASEQWDSGCLNGIFWGLAAGLLFAWMRQ
jgi:hypothetical protein